MTVKIVDAETKVEIVSERRYGRSLANLANEYNVSSDTISRIVKESPLTPVLRKVYGSEINAIDYVMLLGTKAEIEGDICAHNIKITGNIEDGVLIASDAYINMLEPSGNYAFNEGDEYLQGVLRVGVLVLTDAQNRYTSAELNWSDYSEYEKLLPKKEVVPAKVEEVEDVVKTQQNYMWNANSKFISITAGRKTWNADSEHTNFKAALQALVDDNVELALELINVEKAVKRFVKGNIVIQDGQLFYQGLELKSGLVNRILERCSNGEDFEFLLPFLENLLENPSRKTVERLFDFLEANDITITADGHFLAWKVVNSEFKDCRTGTFDNSPGQVVKMPRMLVTDDDQITCSSGLHVCSESYIKIYRGGSDKIVIVKVHPRDVVSIPVDYNNAKMRTCQYEVLSEAIGK
ncbi:hypothetical protein fHeYen901_8 [Yersinia phage fHe-Yen9-01]|uniref:RIIB protector from prophage-induced early lysis n=1 Tax=Yersinia phage fHe-Yen9-01 TaxID=1965363 RepID=A0A1V0DXA4_9CAUD|nr:RIIB lysis inhibitor [Yersinia phage fHe-Yen9-01]ARB05781.1 hypothetical protein fHeYen901_8 [Yersinia phage fHe-Yen9-01]